MPDGNPSAKSLISHIISNPEAMERVKSDPAKALPELMKDLPPALKTDPWIYRVVVSALGLAVLISLVGAIWLVGHGHEKTPDILTAIGSAAVGALAGLLAPSPVSN